MSPKHSAFRTIAMVLVLALTSAIPSAALSKSQNDALSLLAKTAKKRDKEAAKQEKAAYEQRRAAEVMATEAHNKGLRLESSLYRRVGLVLRLIVGALGRERRVLEQIMLSQQYGPPVVSRVVSDALYSLREMERLNAQMTIDEKGARGRLSFAKSQGRDIEVAIIERELLAYQQARAAIEQERTTLDQYLAALGAPSLSELQQRQQDNAEAERRRDQQREAERRRAAEYVANLILTLGAVTALALILQSPTATSEQKNVAQERLNTLKNSARTDCIFRGGTFIDGGAFAIGTCTK